MFDYIDKLRKRPESERRKAVLRISIIATLVVVLVWGIVLAVRISFTDFSFVDRSPERNAPSLKQTLAAFGAEVTNIFQNAERASEAASTTLSVLQASSTVASSTAPTVTTETIPNENK